MIGLSEYELSVLVNNHLTETPYRTGTYHKNKSKKILRLIIDESTDTELLHNLVNEKPDNVIHDFFVSISSDQQSEIVNIPLFLLRLHQEIGGDICFSYTCTFDPDE